MQAQQILRQELCHIHTQWWERPPQCNKNLDHKNIQDLRFRVLLFHTNTSHAKDGANDDHPSGDQDDGCGATKDDDYGGGDDGDHDVHGDDHHDDVRHDVRRGRPHAPLNFRSGLIDMLIEKNTWLAAYLNLIFLRPPYNF